MLLEIQLKSETFVGHIMDFYINIDFTLGESRISARNIIH